MIVILVLLIMAVTDVCVVLKVRLWNKSQMTRQVPFHLHDEDAHEA